MNKYSSNSRVIRLTPPWETAVIAVDVVSGVLLAASVGWLAATTVIDIVKKRKEN